MELAILLITVFVLLVIGSPITVALGVGSLIFILMEGTPSVVVLHRMVSGIDSFPLIGCFMETIAAITILVPVLLPIAEKVGIDPVHLGIIVILNLMLGLLTPPVGMVLYVLSKVSGVKFEKCVIATAPFIVPLLIVLAMITFFPDIAMWLPNVAYRGN